MTLVHAAKDSAFKMQSKAGRCRVPFRCFGAQCLACRIWLMPETQAKHQRNPRGSMWLDLHLVTCNQTHTLHSTQAEVSNEMQELITRKPVWNEQARLQLKFLHWIVLLWARKFAQIWSLAFPCSSCCLS